MTSGLSDPAGERAVAVSPTEPADTKPVLAVRGLSKHFRSGPPWHRRRVDILDDLSLDVRPGELVGLVGENGSGKSTLMQVIVGLLGSDAGSIDRAARVGYCPQQPLLWDKLTVAEHFALFATAYAMSEPEGQAAAASMLDELQFARYEHYRVERLSGGTRQKLNLALALMHDPQLLLLDEPYSGFDWETYLRFWEMSRRRRDEGMGILIVSHLLAERDRLDRVYELRDGKAQLLLTRALAFTREQLRAPFTLVLLIAVPVLFVAAAAGTLHDFATALGGSLAGDAAVALSAGWAAAFLSGALGFFEAASSRGADRRLALAGLGPAKVAISRIIASIALASVAAIAAFVALELRSAVAHPWHAAIAVLAFAWLYLGIGVLVGSLVTDPLEGSLIVVFVFILDVFSGPGMGAAAAPWAISRKAADVLIAAGTGRGSSGGDWVGLVVTTAAALAVAFAVFALSAAAAFVNARIAMATRLGFREQARRPLVIALLVVVPFFFITKAIASTQAIPRRVGLPDGGQVQTTMRDIHGALMAAIAVAFLAGLCGAFIVRSAQQADRRLVVAGFRPFETVIPRLAVLTAATVVVLGVSLAVTALSFTPQSWMAFAAGTLLIGLTYACIGVLAGSLVGQLGATYLVLFLGMLGLGILQNPMFGTGTPNGAALFFPDYGAARVVVEGGFSSSFHAWAELALALGWLAVLIGAVALALRRLLHPRSR